MVVFSSEIILFFSLYLVGSTVDTRRNEQEREGASPPSPPK